MLERVLIIIGCILLCESSHVMADSKPFRGFNSVSQNFKRICEGLKEDHRIELFVKVARDHAERDPLCEGCRPLMRTILASCSSMVRADDTKIIKSKKKTKKSKEETPIAESDTTPQPAVSPTPVVVKAREPNTALLDELSETARIIAENTEGGERSIPAIQKLVFLLRDKSVVAPGAEAEYYDIFCEYLYAPFVELETELAGKSRKTDTEPENSQKDLGNLFDE